MQTEYTYNYLLNNMRDTGMCYVYYILKYQNIWNDDTI